MELKGGKSGKADSRIREVYRAGSEAELECRGEGTTYQNACGDAEEFSEGEIHTFKRDIVLCSISDSGDFCGGVGNCELRLDTRNDSAIFADVNTNNSDGVLCETLLLFRKSYSKII